MPLPSPRGKEEKNDFVSRCVSELSDKDEFSSQDQRVAVCYTQWDKVKKESMSTTTGPEVTISRGRRNSYEIMTQGSITYNKDFDYGGAVDFLTKIGIEQKAIKATLDAISEYGGSVSFGFPANMFFDVIALLQENRMQFHRVQILEDQVVPGTNVVLEAGDIVKVRLPEAEDALAKVMKKVSGGKDLSDGDKKVLATAIGTVKGDDKEDLDKIMKKVRDGKELTDTEQKKLGAALAVIKKKDESVERVAESLSMNAVDDFAMKMVDYLVAGSEKPERYGVNVGEVVAVSIIQAMEDLEVVESVQKQFLKGFMTGLQSEL